MEVLDESHDILIVTKKGYGKRTPMADYRLQTRGGKGIKTCNITEKNGAVVALKTVVPELDLMMITSNGIIIRMDVASISQTGRNTQGVKLMNVNEGNQVATVAVVEKDEEEPAVEPLETAEDMEVVENEAPDETEADDEGSTEE
jgi:DNA gyrase subunit A